MGYSWPGNVRELRNIVQRLGISCSDRPVRANDVIRYFSDGTLSAPLFPVMGDEAFLPHGADSAPPNAVKQASLHLPEQNPDRTRLMETLERYGYNLSAAARAMGITRATIYRRMKKHGITVRRRGE